MKGSTLKVFSIIKNTQDIVEKNKNIDTYKLRHSIWYDRQPKYIKNQCYGIFNDIENGCFSYKDLTNAIYSIYLYKKKVNLNELKSKSINTIKETLTKEQFIHDKKVLLEVNKEIKLKGIQDYFKIKEGGNSLVYELIQSKCISPILFVKLLNEVTIENIDSESPEHRKFRRIIEILKNNMTRSQEEN